MWLARHVSSFLIAAIYVANHGPTRSPQPNHPAKSEKFDTENRKCNCNLCVSHASPTKQPLSEVPLPQPATATHGRSFGCVASVANIATRPSGKHPRSDRSPIAWEHPGSDTENPIAWERDDLIEDGGSVSGGEPQPWKLQAPRQTFQSLRPRTDNETAEYRQYSPSALTNAPISGLESPAAPEATTTVAPANPAANPSVNSGTVRSCTDESTEPCVAGTVPAIKVAATAAAAASSSQDTRDQSATVTIVLGYSPRASGDKLTSAAAAEGGAHVSPRRVIDQQIESNASAERTAERSSRNIKGLADQKPEGEFGSLSHWSSGTAGSNGSSTRQRNMPSRRRDGIHRRSHAATHVVPLGARGAQIELALELLPEKNSRDPLTLTIREDIAKQNALGEKGLLEGVASGSGSSRTATVTLESLASVNSARGRPTCRLPGTCDISGAEPVFHGSRLHRQLRTSTRETERGAFKVYTPLSETNGIIAFGWSTSPRMTTTSRGRNKTGESSWEQSLRHNLGISTATACSLLDILVLFTCMAAVAAGGKQDRHVERQAAAKRLVASCSSTLTAFTSACNRQFPRDLLPVTRALLQTDAGCPAERIPQCVMVLHSQQDCFGPATPFGSLSTAASSPLVSHQCLSDGNRGRSSAGGVSGSDESLGKAISSPTRGSLPAEWTAFAVALKKVAACIHRRSRKAAGCTYKSPRDNSIRNTCKAGRQRLQPQPRWPARGHVMRHDCNVTLCPPLLQTKRSAGCYSLTSHKHLVEPSCSSALLSTSNTMGGQASIGSALDIAERNNVEAISLQQNVAATRVKPEATAQLPTTSIGDSAETEQIADSNRSLEQMSMSLSRKASEAQNAAAPARTGALSSTARQLSGDPTPDMPMPVVSLDEEKLQESNPSFKATRAGKSAMSPAVASQATASAKNAATLVNLLQKTHDKLTQPGSLLAMRALPVIKEAGTVLLEAKKLPCGARLGSAPASNCLQRAFSMQQQLNSTQCLLPRDTIGSSIYHVTDPTTAVLDTSRPACDSPWLQPEQHRVKQCEDCHGNKEADRREQQQTGGYEGGNLPTTRQRELSTTTRKPSRLVASSAEFQSASPCASSISSDEQQQTNKQPRKRVQSIAKLLQPQHGVRPRKRRKGQCTVHEQPATSSGSQAGWPTENSIDNRQQEQAEQVHTARENGSVGGKVDFASTDCVQNNSSNFTVSCDLCLRGVATTNAELPPVGHRSKMQSAATDRNPQGLQKAQHFGQTSVGPQAMNEELLVPSVVPGPSHPDNNSSKAVSEQLAPPYCPYPPYFSHAPNAQEARNEQKTDTESLLTRIKNSTKCLQEENSLQRTNGDGQQQPGSSAANNTTPGPGNCLKRSKRAESQGFRTNFGSANIGLDGSRKCRWHRNAVELPWNDCGGRNASASVERSLQLESQTDSAGRCVRQLLGRATVDRLCDEEAPVEAAVDVHLPADEPTRPDAATGITRAERVANLEAAEASAAADSTTAVCSSRRRSRVKPHAARNVGDPYICCQGRHQCWSCEYPVYMAARLGSTDLIHVAKASHMSASSRRWLDLGVHVSRVSDESSDNISSRRDAKDAGGRSGSSSIASVSSILSSSGGSDSFSSSDSGSGGCCSGNDNSSSRRTSLAYTDSCKHFLSLLAFAFPENQGRAGAISSTWSVGSIVDVSPCGPRPSTTVATDLQPRLTFVVPSTML